MQNNISYDTKKIIKKYRIKNKLKQTQMVDLMGCSISTIRKIETDETYIVGKKIIYQFLKLNDISKEEKKYIQKYLLEIENKKKKSNNDTKKIESYYSNFEKSIESFEKNIFDFLNENMIKLTETLMFWISDKKTKNSKELSGNDIMRLNSFKNDFHATNRIVNILFKYKTEISKYHSELTLLLSSNTLESNVKIERGIIDISNELISKGNELKKFINDENIKIIEEE